MSREEKLKKRMVAEVRRADDPLDQLTAACLGRGYSGLLALGRMFRRQDPNKTWTLTRAQMASVIAEFGLEFSQEKLKNLFDQFDSDNTGKVDYEEFLDGIRPPMSDPRKEVVAMAFNMLDDTEDGLVNINDIRRRYSAANHPRVLSKEQTEEEVVQRLIGRFQNNIGDDGMMTKAEFFDYYTGVSKSIADDDCFVEMMRQAWGLDL